MTISTHANSKILQNIIGDLDHGVHIHMTRLLVKLLVVFLCVYGGVWLGELGMHLELGDTAHLAQNNNHL